jgi:hypothetical protein
MKYKDFVVGTRWSFRVHPAQCVMSRARDIFPRVLVGLANVNEDSASAHEFGGALGRN